MTPEAPHTPISGTPYSYDRRLTPFLTQLQIRVEALRTLSTSLSGEALTQLQAYFRLKTIYTSNAIEGNSLSMGETQLVIAQGLTITGKPLRDSIETQNLAQALEFFETLVDRKTEAITIG
ncbi:MAG: hypothetical protein H7Y11_13040, partial [Armatimonadetes bacterium]|nr:hypothetical protein [Anaerolineae bacterium]